MIPSVRSLRRAAFRTLTPTGRRQVAALREVAEVGGYMVRELAATYEGRAFALEKVSDDLADLLRLTSDLPPHVAAAMTGAWGEFTRRGSVRATLVAAPKDELDLLASRVVDVEVAARRELGG